ncbi:MAG: neutral/alkaline non-lysosomal ceramidase N-terminal domain-containing protein [Pirellulaceae bacterium]|nr:neutral/alkaline non-lysosomal ceramidase N-terminal domain-containing protein [Pirellulaceae bacterium]
MLLRVSIIVALHVGLMLSRDATAQADKPNVFKAGAAVVDITPRDIGPDNPSIIAGSFLEGTATSVHAPLFVRTLVLDDGQTRIVLSVVDTCMMTQSLIDEAKSLASQQCGIDSQRMMVAATHTHSAPAAMSCLGTRQDKKYAARLPGKIAECIVAAQQNLVPARIGWASVDDWQHTHNRRWIRKPESKIVDPFGEATGLAHMHPGHQSPEVIGPSGPVDPALSVIAVKTLDDQPLAVFANYSQHYFGAPAVSSDYFGLFCKHLATIMRQPGEGNGPFVAAISQGTSGDLMWMDYGSPANSPTLTGYAEQVARYAEKALAKVEYRDFVELKMVERKLALNYRVPDQRRLDWARTVAAEMGERLPKTLPEVYAHEAIFLHDMQKTQLKLQAIRIGDLTIATLPNEVYALTGLKLRGRSPAISHFNIELANGAEGYIPTPEQHVLGGYTTWPARTAGLEVEAESKIVETLTQALEEATGQPRHVMQDQHGPYAQKILDSKPVQYWRLNDEDGNTPRNAAPTGLPARLSPGFAWFLPGVGSGTGIGQREALTFSEFSGPNQINRAVHLAGGSMQCSTAGLSSDYSISLWFWLGERSGASQRQGALIQGPTGELLTAMQNAQHQVTLKLLDQTSTWHGRADQWNFVTLVRHHNQLSVFANGLPQPVVSAASLGNSLSETMIIGQGLQGKVDEVAVFNSALTTEQLQQFWSVSKIQLEHQQDATEQQAEERERNARLKPPAFSTDYAHWIQSIEPNWFAPLDALPDNLNSSGKVSFHPATFAQFESGRLSGTMSPSPSAYSVSLWFRNDLPISARAVTAYLFSRGPDADAQAAGDHLGIGGSYRNDLTGKLIVFNGNLRNQVLVGKNIVTPGFWHHLVLQRDGSRAKVWLDGQVEIEGELESTASDANQFYLGARNDQFAPLQGGLAYAAIFGRLIEDQLVPALFENSGIASSARATQVAPARTTTSQPISPQESLAGMHVPLGYRVDLMACEPQVLDPVAFDWDAAGRLWIVEMADYPLGLDGQGEPGGRVRVLEDTDGDGRYETSQLFADKLSFPTGILTWRDGALVTAAPQLLFLQDTDGDGRADVREVLFAGFNEGNQQLRMNGLRWGIDNWVYCANGGHHAAHGLGVQVRSIRNGRTYELGSRDFRFNPDTGELQVESGPSQFGRNRDEWGHWFGTQNASPLWHYVLPDRYVARNPHVPTVSPIHHVVPTGSPPVYPASPLEKRYHSFEQSGRYTSACGSTIYGDNLLFPLIRSATPNDQRPQPGHCFTCEPFHNLVQHNWMIDDGVSYTGIRPDNEGAIDFFASRDRWCRPVMVRTGPDGGLWVADMYRYMIEHPDWLPAEGRAELLPHYRLGDDRGRIYRIFPSIEPHHPVPKLTGANTQQLIRYLASSNMWLRDKAHQMLWWQQAPQAAELLERALGDHDSPTARIHIINLLDGMSALRDPILLTALNDPHPRVREHAVRLAENSSSAAVIAAACKLFADVDAKVCLQLALSAGQWTDPVAAEALVELARRFPAEPYMVSAIMSSALAHERLFAKGIFVSQDEEVQAAFREPLLRQSIGRANFGTMTTVFESLFNLPESAQVTANYELLQTLRSIGAEFNKLLQDDSNMELTTIAARLESLWSRALARVSDQDADIASRLAAAKLLLHSPTHRSSAITALADFLSPHVDSLTQSQALNALSQSAADDVPEILGGAWNQLTPNLRSQAIDVWLLRTAWTADLLQRLESQQISASSLSLTQRSQLLQHPVNAIAQRAPQTLAQTTPSSRTAVIAKYQPALQLAGDMVNGRQVYLKSCASCHRHGNDDGHDVGPNLATVVSHAPEKLLASILDPNLDIQPGYQAYTCLLESGEILSGILISETASSVTIKQANGAIRSITRREIEQLTTANKSFMPEGLEENLALQDLADLIHFLRQP